MTPLGTKRDTPDVQHPQAPWIEFTQTARGIVIGCNVCQAKAGPLTPAAADQFSRAHYEHRSTSSAHYGMGDAIAAATKAVGITPCTPCEARRRALNQLFPKVWRR